jgi:hypothetical protein
MNPDNYSFIAECPECKTPRGVSCSRAQVKTGEPVKVYAVHCDHGWTLTPGASSKLRENSSVFGS